MDYCSHFNFVSFLYSYSIKLTFWTNCSLWVTVKKRSQLKLNLTSYPVLLWEFSLCHTKCQLLFMGPAQCRPEVQKVQQITNLKTSEIIFFVDWATNFAVRDLLKTDLLVFLILCLLHVPWVLANFDIDEWKFDAVFRFLATKEVRRTIMHF